jgi:hypothetical protein
MVKVDGAMAYVVADKSLAVVDISNPAAPKRAGTYAFPDKIWGFTVARSLVYAAADLAGVHIVDATNAAMPALRGTFKTKGQSHGVAVFGTKALIADHMLGVDLLDVSEPGKASSLGSFFLEGYPRDVITSGSLAYAVDSPTGFYVFDLAKPGPLEPVGSLQTANGRALAVAGESDSAPHKVVCVTGGPAVQIIDVSNPAAPVLASTYRTPGGRPARAAMTGTLAYVADAASGLHVLDVSTPANPRIVGAHETGPARDVAVADSLVFVVAGSEVVILRRAP